MGSDFEKVIAIRIPTSISGKRRHECPRDGCQPAEFLVSLQPGSGPTTLPSDRMRRQPNTSGMTCPYCGHDGPEDHFYHPLDVDHIHAHQKQALLELAMNALTGGMKPGSKRTTRTSARRRATGVTFELTETTAPLPPPPEADSPDDLLRNVSCGVCAREYGVFALALFCPDCGAPNLSTHVEREAALIHADLADAKQLRQSGDLERAARRLFNAIQNVATTLETHLKATFALVARRRLPGPDADALLKKVGTAFQNSVRGRELFNQFAFDPYGGMEADELRALNGMMSKRHTIAHNLGIADEKYVAQAGVGTPGTSVSLEAADVTSFLEILRTVVEHCEKNLPEFMPAPSSPPQSSPPNVK